MLQPFCVVYSLDIWCVKALTLSIYHQETYPSSVETGCFCIFTLLSDHLVGPNKRKEHSGVPQHSETK